MKKNINEKGVAHLLLMVLIMVVLIVVAVSYRVVAQRQASKSRVDITTEAPIQNDVEKTPEVGNPVDEVLPGTPVDEASTKLYEDSKYHFSFRYPSDWTIKVTDISTPVARGIILQAPGTTVEVVDDAFIKANTGAEIDIFVGKSVTSLSEALTDAFYVQNFGTDLMLGTDKASQFPRLDDKVPTVITHPKVSSTEHTFRLIFTPSDTPVDREKSYLTSKYWPAYDIVIKSFKNK